MTHMSLFTGIGGLDIAAEWAGFTTIGQCEFADYPTKVLQKHWPDVPRWRDIRTLTKEDFYARTGLRTVDIISGGFPCQPFSVAGKQKGREDERYLWPEMLRVITELAPRWVIGENVPGILSIAAADIVQSLERAGYRVAVFDFEAAAVGALHRRERIFFVANAEHNGSSTATVDGISDQTGDNKQERQDATGEPARMCGRENCETLGNANGRMCRGNDRRIKQTGFEKRCENVADTYGRSVRHDSHNIRPTDREINAFDNPGCDCRANWWAVEPNVGRVAHGVPKRVDRLKCLGNAVVPQQAYPIFRAIAEEIERR